MPTLQLLSGSAAQPPHIVHSSAPQNFHPSDCSRDSAQNLRKRKRSISEDSEHIVRSKEKKTEVRMSGIRPPGFVYPKTAYDGHLPSMPRYSEECVLADILAKDEQQDDSGTDTSTNGDAFVEADLQDFVIYRPHKYRTAKSSAGATEVAHANELVSLHEINEFRVKHFYFNGIICYAGRQRYVQKVPFEILSIGGYEEQERSSVGPYIWIQSIQGTKLGVWYRLTHPAAEYKRYHEPFLWMADLAKHFVDYLQTRNGVTLLELRRPFYEWLQDLYPTDGCVRRWLEQYGDHDFRRVVAAHANFLYFQATQVDRKYEKHPIWEEIHPKTLRAIPEQVERTTKNVFAALREREDIVLRRKTTVTPYVFKCFEQLPWEKFLHCQSSSAALHRSQGTSATDHIWLGPTTRPTFQKLEVRIPFGRIPVDRDSSLKAQPMTVSVGDVVAIPKDDNSAWKTEDADYLGYVQSVSDTDEGQALGLLWFYRPGDTTCLEMFYPHPRELFLSDHCNCNDPLVLASHVIRKPQVTFGGPEKYTDFFCRQRYIEGDGAWTTLQGSRFRCGCRGVEPPDVEPPKYSVGDTLLVASSLRKNLEPVILLEHDPDGLDGRIKVVKLLRKGRDYGCHDAAANELVLTDRSEVIPMAYVHRRCHIRFYSQMEKEERRIPSPYDRQGASDFFYITSQHLQTSESGLESIQTPWPSFMRQGWDPTSPLPQRRLRGLDMFCGGGNFGRGLEEGGAVRFDWAIDWYNEAIHTYKANLPTQDQNQTKLFRGSVNHYLSEAMEGNGGNDLIAQFGEVEFICAGSPCQGYSLANPNKGNDCGLVNESMVASVMAFIDFYRPKYALLENVKGMAMGDEKHNVLAQVVCCLVGMGYQVRASCLDAWNFGCCQRRSRIIIAIAAPGLAPLPEPAHTHSHPDGVWGGSLGKTANGRHTGSRTTSQTPFEYITSAEATKDLPATDARTTCIPFPDHRMSRSLPVIGWVRISSVPRFPGGCTFVKASKQGYMPQAQIDKFNWNEHIRARPDSKSWQRVRRNALVPTVMTAARPEDGTGGDCLHWDDHRLLTILEVRRAQGFPDHEVLIGPPGEQWKMVGNSVARPVALALGVSLRTAWLANSNTPAARDSINGNAAFEDSINGNAAFEDSINGNAAFEDSINGKNERAGEVACNGWIAQDMLLKLSAALTSPRSLVSAISGTIGKQLTNGDHQAAGAPDSQPLKYTDSVKAGRGQSLPAGAS